MDNVDNDINHFITKELLEEDHEVRSQFYNQFRPQISEFINEVSTAFDAWKKYDLKIGNDKRSAYVSAFLYNGLTNLLVSTKLLITGYSIPSGNLVRQTIEAICSALLCSAKSLRYFEQIDQEHFAPHKAGKLLLKHYKVLNVDQKAAQALTKLNAFYHKLSHSTLLALAHNMSFSNLGKTYPGPSFDAAKIFAYEKEIKTRINLAKNIANVCSAMRLL
jgi:hypothetical protein